MDSSTADMCLNIHFATISDQNKLRCETYTTEEYTVVSIDDKKQVNSSSGFFHSKYSIISELCETDSSVVFVGSKSNGTQVVIKTSHFHD